MGFPVSVPYGRTKGPSWRPGERIGGHPPAVIAPHRGPHGRMLNLVPEGGRRLQPVLAAYSVWWRCKRPPR